MADFDPGQFSAADFDRRITELDHQVARKRLALERAEAELAWWRKGRELFVGPDASKAAPAATSNGAPETLGEAIVAVMRGPGTLRVQEIFQRLVAQGWVEDTAEAKHRVRSRVWSMAHRTRRLEKISRGTYRLLESEPWLASRNDVGDIDQGPDENDVSEPLSTATRRQEGA